MLSIAGIVAYSVYDKQEKTELREVNTLLVEQAKTALASPLWNFDQTQIADAAASIMKTRAAYAVVIRQQKTGEIIYALVRDRQWKTVPMGKEVMSTEGLLSGESPIVYSSQTIGSVQVYVTQTFLKAKLAKIQMAFILCFLIVLAMLITVLYFLLRYIILRPVQLLAEYSQTVKSGKGDTALIPTGSFMGEVETLRSSISEMVGLLQVRYRELQRETRRVLESEKQFHTLIQTIPDLIWLKDCEGIYLACNQLFEKLYGAKEAEIIGKTDYDFASKDQADFFRANDLKAIAAGKPTSNEEWLTFAIGGARILVETVKTPMYGADGTLIGVLGIARDITERKRVEDALKQSEEKFAMAFRSSPDIMLISAIDKGRILEVNERAERILGYSREDLIGKSPVDLGIWANVSQRDDYVAYLNRDGAVHDLDIQIRTKSGTILDMLLSGELFELEGEKCILGTIRDVTEHKRAEKALQVAQHLYESIFRLSPELIVVTTQAEGRYLAVNDAHERIIGYSRDEVIGHFVSEFPDWDSPAERQKIIQRLNEHKVVSNVEVIFRRKSGERFTALFSAVLAEVNGEQCMVSMLNEITEHKNAEAAMRESEERFRQMAENIEEIFFLYQKEGNRLLYMSPVISRLFGVGFETIQADPQMIDRAVHPDDIPQVKFTNLETFYSQPLNEEFRIITPQGAVRWLRLRSFLIHDERGTVVRVAGLAADITSFKQAQEENLLKQQQLIQADKMASLGVMVSGIAQEINNPNNFITMSMPLLRQAWESILPIVENHYKTDKSLKIGSMSYREFMDSFDQLMSGINDGSQRIKHIVADLKDYARVDSADRNRVFDFNQTVASAVNLMNNMIRKKPKTSPRTFRART